MKFLHYLVGFNAFALAYFLFSEVLCAPDTLVNSYIIACTIFSVLSATAVYNILEGIRLQLKR